MVPARLLDLSRLVSRLGRGPMTGVDRVEFAYLDHLLALPDPVGQKLERRLHGVDAHRHVDQPVAHHLVGDQRLAEGFAAAGIVGGDLLRAQAGAQPAHAVRQTATTRY